MYLHLGQSVVVSEETIIGIFDLDNTTESHITRRFLGNAEKTGSVTNVSDDLPNTFVVCSDGDVNRVFLSQLSSQTLSKRTGTMRFE